MTSSIQWLASALWALAVLLTFLGSHLSLRRRRSANWRRRQIATAEHARFKPISILKPLKGTDPGLRENLNSFFELDYPSYELIFSVADANDQAHSIVKELQLLHPGVRSYVVIGAVDVGANPKVNNLIKSFDLAHHDWVLISDSNIRVRPDYLRRLALQFDENVGVLTAVVRGGEADTFGGRLEATFLNTYYARWMYLAFAFGQPIVLGKSMLLQRSVARRFGGFKTLARYLAEDYMAGEAMQKLGFRIELLDDPVTQPLTGYSYEDFWKRHVRWGRIRKSQAPVLFFLEPFLTSIPSGLIGAAVVAPQIEMAASNFLIAHLLCWFMADQSIEAGLAGRRAIRDVARALPVWIAREVLAIPLWFTIASGNTVNWRGKILKVEYGGILTTEEG